MSRSGYSDDCDGWALIRWRGAVESALRGKRGQAFLRELRDALDAMPVKELISGELEANGCHCALGVVGASRGIDMTTIDPYERHIVAERFDVAEAMAAEIMYINDESGYGPDAPAKRWKAVRNWVEQNIVEQPSVDAATA